MGKGKRKKEKKIKTPQYDSDDERAYSKEAVPDPQSEDYYQDEIDEFHANREKVLLEKGSSLEQPDFSSDENEEVLGLGSDSDEEIAEYEAQLRRFKVQGHKEDMGSDIEDAPDDGLPDDKAWGQKRSKYYGADVSDNEDIDFSGSEPDAAELEEREALVIQKRLAEQLDEEDMELEIFQQAKKPTEDTVKEKEKITKDLSKLTKKEKLQLLKRESPELLELIEDYKTKMTEVRDVLLPIEKLIREGSIPKASTGAEFIQTKIKLYLNYCVNINFYLMLKAKHAPVHNHPVIGRLVQYRNLIKQLEPAAEKLKPEIEKVLKMVKNGEVIKPADNAPREVKAAASRRLKTSAVAASVPGKKKRPAPEEAEEDVEEGLELEQPAEMSGGRTWGRKRRHGEEEGVEEEREMEGIDEDYEQEDEKRGITYQIAKNVGLTAHKKKELRNPRVKHRLKYRKAKIRRRGQIREVRTEMERYGGEISGIRAGIKRSIKFKQ